MIKKAFVTSSVYALAKKLGQKAAIQEVRRQLDSPSRESLPMVRTIYKLSKIAPDIELPLMIDGGATYIGMARSRAFHEAYKSGAPAWIAIDDDLEVTQDSCVAMLDALDDVVPRIILTPYYERSDDDAPRLTCPIPLIRNERRIAGGSLLALPPSSGGGFGFVGMNRAAMLKIVTAAKQDKAFQWFDHGEEKLALFYERLEDGLWYGEDISFFKWRVPPTVSVELLLVGTSIHGGVALNLFSL